MNSTSKAIAFSMLCLLGATAVLVLTPFGEGIREFCLTDAPEAKSRQTQKEMILEMADNPEKAKGKEFTLTVYLWSDYSSAVFNRSRVEETGGKLRYFQARPCEWKAIGDGASTLLWLDVPESIEAPNLNASDQAVVTFVFSGRNHPTSASIVKAIRRP